MHKFFKPWVVLPILVIVAAFLVFSGITIVRYNNHLHQGIEGWDNPTKIDSSIEALKDLDDWQFDYIRDKTYINYHLGLLYYRSGDHEKALSYFQKALKQTTNHELRGKIYYNMGVMLLEEIINSGEDGEKLEIVVGHLQNALRENPNDWQAKANLEKLLSGEGVIIPGNNDDPGSNYGEGTPEKEF